MRCTSNDIAIVYFATQQTKKEINKKLKRVKDKFPDKYFGYSQHILNDSKNPVLIIDNKTVHHTEAKELIKKINERVGFVYLIGETGTILAEEMNKVGYKKYKNLGTLEKVLLDIKQNIDFEDSQTILFSPATASFDQFKNFEERGRIFKELTNKILGEK